MEELMMFAVYLEGINAILSIILLWLYAQNYSALKSNVGLGLIVFAGLLTLQNVVGLFLHFTTGEFYVKMAATQVFFLEFVETIALIVLAYTCWNDE